MVNRRHFCFMSQLSSPIELAGRAGAAQVMGGSPNSAVAVFYTNNCRVSRSLCQIVYKATVALGRFRYPVLHELDVRRGEAAERARLFHV